MRFSKPTTEIAGRVGRARFPALIAVAIGIASACYSPPALLERRFHPDRVYLKHAVFEMRLEFLNQARLLDRARWLNHGESALRRRGAADGPAFPEAKRAPDLSAIEITIFNFGRSSAPLDLRRFRIYDITPADGASHTPPARPGSASGASNAGLAPIGATRLRREYAGHAIGALAADEFAFVQNEVHRFAQPLPDWYSHYRANFADTISAAERARRAEFLDREKETLVQTNPARACLHAGGEIQGIILFPLLPENRDYLLRYEVDASLTGGNGVARNPALQAQAADSGTGICDPSTARSERRTVRQFRPPDLVFAYRTRRRPATATHAFKNTFVADDDRERDAGRRTRSAIDAFRMHEQLRTHERLSQDSD